MTLKTELSTKQMAISSMHSFIHSCKESNVITLMMPSEEKKSRLLCVLPGDVQVASRRCTARRLSKDRAREKRSVNVENITVRGEKKKRMTKVTEWTQTHDDTWFLIYYIASVCLTVQLSHCFSLSLTPTYFDYNQLYWACHSYPCWFNEWTHRHFAFQRLTSKEKKLLQKSIALSSVGAFVHKKARGGRQAWTRARGTILLKQTGRRFSQRGAKDWR